MDYRQMLDTVLGVLREARGNAFGLGELDEATFQRSRQAGLTQYPPQEYRHWPQHAPERLALEEVLNDLLRWGVLNLVMPNTHMSQGIRFYSFRITTYGRGVIAQEAPSVYDPDGYLDHVTKVVRECSQREPDEVVLEYVAEALSVFRSSGWRSTVVMAGLACERLSIILQDALRQSSAMSRIGQKEAKQMARPDLKAGERLTAIGAALQQLKDETPLEIKEACRTLPIVLDSIRRTRNDHGHPTEVIAHRETALMAVAVLPQICRNVYSIISWLERSSEVEDSPPV